MNVEGDPPRTAPETAAVGSPSRFPTFAEATRFWLKLGLISFGGPTGQIAIMHTELVERRKWISETRFLHALNYCMLLPGPEAMQLATYIGWLLHRTRGGIVAGALFVLPSALLLWSLSWLYVTYGQVPWVAAVFYGLKPAVLGLVAAAALRLGRQALRSLALWGIAAFAFVAIYFLNAPFPLIVLSAAAVGWLGGRFLPEQFRPGGEGDGTRGPSGEGVLSDAAEPPAHATPSVARAVRVAVVCLVAWWAPIVALGQGFGWDHALFREGLFFSKAAMVTFGGAYAVLPYVQQEAVHHYGWLSAGNMLDGLALAETTPGPLIIVVQFVGFLGAWNHPGGLPPLLAATLGAILTTWATFVPCFLWIFLGAPHIEQLRNRPRLGAALSSVTAAVVGVILNLAVWFGWHLLRPAPGEIDMFAAAVSLVVFLGLWRLRWPLIPVIVGAGAVGLIYRLLN